VKRIDDAWLMLMKKWMLLIEAGVYADVDDWRGLLLADEADVDDEEL